MDSLIDKGDNGSVASNNVRVIAAHSDRIVDMRSIYNHELIATLLITTGEFTWSIDSEVIFIMHQHACHWKNKTIY